MSKYIIGLPCPRCNKQLVEAEDGSALCVNLKCSVAVSQRKLGLYPISNHHLIVEEVKPVQLEGSVNIMNACNNSTKPVDIMLTVKSNMTEAAWRSASDTAVELVRAPLSATLAGRLPNNASARIIAEFLQTEHGTAFLAVAMGFAPLFFPQLLADPRIAKLSEEMRIGGLQNVSDKVLKDLAGPVIAAFTQAVSGLPALPPVSG